MKIGIFSDLHLEFRKTDELMYLIEMLSKADVDILINAGDLHPDPNVRKVFRSTVGRSRTILNVRGNHDFYGNQKFNTSYNRTIEGGVSFALSELWTNFRNNPDIAHAANRHIMDFRQIDGCTPEVMTKGNVEARQFLKDEKADVIVTHFAPHPGSTHPRYTYDVDYTTQLLNGYFVNDCTDVLEEAKPKLWIHGHVHDAFDYKFGDTRIVCNPLGYPREHYNTVEDYKLKVVEI